MADVVITLTDNGPYIVRGDVKVVDAEGNEFEKKETTALCRCGRSATKPFCDGSHTGASFQDQVRAK